MIKNKILLTALITIISANVSLADSAFMSKSDFTGDSFFRPPSFDNEINEGNEQSKSKNTSTTPPIKKLRLTIQEHARERNAKKLQLAPTNPDATIYDTKTETSDYASKEVEENFDENMMPDGFEADEESVKENQKSRKFFGKKNKNSVVVDEENSENIIMDCDNMDYDTDKFCLYANGNVNVEFVNQQTIVKADTIIYDRMNNTIKAEGNVKILKNGQTITGDYIFVDMNEENALIENPIATANCVEIRAKKGYVYGDKIEQENGSIVVDSSFPINFVSSENGPRVLNMMVPKDQRLTTDMEKGLIKVDAKSIKITEKDDMEILAIKRLNVKKGKHTILKVPGLKIYSNKNHDYVETNSWEIGTMRDLGLYVGPGFVFELPKGSVFKAIPMLNYKSGIGVGAVGRFNSGTNRTQVGYGTAASKILVHGIQKLDDNLFLQYGMNDYLDEWFLGRRRPKYGLDLVYSKSYSSDQFLLKGHTSSYSHRLDLGYYHDIKEDYHYKQLHGGGIGTLRTRYMAEAAQNLLRYRNEDKQTEFSFDIAGQLSAAVYGTGDTQFIGRIGPRMHTQWKRWMQDIGYFQSVFDDHSPVPVFDAYRYGKSNFYVREYLRICRYLTLCWFGSFNLSNDSPNNKTLQENSFYVSLGPDDFKFNIGYDTIRENTFFTFEVMMDAKGTHIDYDKLEIKQNKKAKKEEEDKKAEKKETTVFQNPQKAPVLQKAVVEDIKNIEEVL